MPLPSPREKTKEEATRRTMIQEMTFTLPIARRLRVREERSDQRWIPWTGVCRVEASDTHFSSARRRRRRSATNSPDRFCSSCVVELGRERDDRTEISFRATNTMSDRLREHNNTDGTLVIRAIASSHWSIPCR
jgi:hypothetical protein